MQKPADAHYLDSHLNIVASIKGEPVVNPSRQNDKVTSLNPDSNPTVILVSNIKVPTSF